MSNEGYGFKETSDIIEKISNYQEDHIEKHYQTLGKRLNVVNQTIRGDNTSLDTIRLSKITKQMSLLEERYINISSTASVEEKVNVMALVNEINKQIEKLEGKSGGNDGD